MFDDESFLGHAKRLLVGKPIPSSLAHHQRLGKATGLAVLSSDALSSVAYASEEILRVLMIGGLAAMTLSRPISLMIATLLAVVAFSYRQTIKVYSKGGGGAPHRLHLDGRRVGRGRCRRAHLGVSRPAYQPRDNGDRVRGAADRREPARPPRVGTRVFGAYVRVHRADAPARLRGLLPSDDRHDARGGRGRAAGDAR